MITVQRIGAEALTLPSARRILQLKNTVWPSSVELDAQCHAYLARNAVRPKRQLFLLERGDALLGHAELFNRMIGCGEVRFEVGCLGGVCILPQQQGHGLGRLLVENTFKVVDENDYRVVLFQTQVPEFYKKLGAHQINNAFINSQSEHPDRNPWADEHIMIYPAHYPWPKGTIDLNGGDY